MFLFTGYDGEGESEKYSSSDDGKESYTAEKDKEGESSEDYSY